MLKLVDLAPELCYNLFRGISMFRFYTPILDFLIRISLFGFISSLIIGRWSLADFPAQMNVLLGLGLLFVGICEEIIYIFYIKAAVKGYKGLCASLQYSRSWIYFAVTLYVAKYLEHSAFYFNFYALGCMFGDYVGLYLEPIIDKKILKIQRRGRKKRFNRWFKKGGKSR